MEGVKPQYSPIKCDVTYSHEETRQMLYCNICKLDLKGKIQFEAHIKSKRHRGMLKQLKKTSELIGLHAKNLKGLSQDNVPT